MLCYADAYVDHTIKNSYIILTETGSIVVRHDYYFRHFTPFPSLVNAEVKSFILPRSSEKFQSIMMTCSSTSKRTMTPQTEIIYNDADYDQLLGQAEHGSIPLQSSILRNPWFLKEVTARLQRNEDEASSDDESFVSNTEVPFAGPSTAEIHKANKVDSDPLEPRVTKSKSRSLNIDDLIKGTEVNASSSDSMFRCSARASYRSQ
jgi:hypothetical protein